MSASTTTGGLTAKSSFENLLKLVSLIAVLVLVFGQSYAQLLLQLYGGDRLGQNMTCVYMLRLHCVYVYFLAVNGVTESFFNATKSESQLQTHNKRLILFSATFLVLAFIFSKVFSIYGFLLANCVNMFIRICYSSGHIKNVFKGFEHQSESFVAASSVYNIIDCYLPDRFVSLSLILSLVLTQASEAYLYDAFKLGHLVIGAALFLATLFVIYRQEKNVVAFVFKFFKITKNK